MAYNHDLQGWRHFIQSTPCKPSWGVCRPPKTHRKRNSKQDHCPIMEKSARRSFSNGALFLALLCKPPPERITSHFVILPRQNRLFSAYIYLHNIPKGKKIGKHLAYLAYIFNAFFSFWGDLGALVGALVVLFLLVAGHQLETYPRWYRNAPAR